MDLPLIWFVLIAVLWTGYLVLEGFDFGVGALLPVLGRRGTAEAEAAVGGADDEQDPAKRRRVMLTTIGPHWDGNEVWLITAAGAMFAAFPAWYATTFSTFYLVMLLILVALIMRNMGLEYRLKRDNETWRRRWDLAITGGSVATPFLVGLFLTTMVRGVPLNSESEFVGSLASIISLPGLLGGLAFVALSVTHGGHFLGLRTAGDIREDARVVAQRAGIAATVLGGALLLWLISSNGSPMVVVLAVIAVVGLVGGLVANRADREGIAFVGTTLAWVGTAAAYFVALWPNVLPTTLDGGAPLTAAAAASSPMTLEIMTWAAAIFMPLVLAYTAFSYWVFRKRLATHHLPAYAAVK